MTLQKVRQLQKLETFYNGMYRFLLYEHLPKDNLLATLWIMNNYIINETDGTQAHIQTIVYS